jgi:DNA-binding beta-propeller fold protein YncE
MFVLTAAVGLAGCAANAPAPRVAAARPAARRATPPRVQRLLRLGPAVSDTRGGKVLTTDWIRRGAGALWVINERQPMLYEVDPKTVRVVRRRRLPQLADATHAVGLGSVWIATHDGHVDRLDVRTLRLRARIPVGADSRAVAIAGGYVWVSDRRDGRVRRIDPRRDVVTASTRVHRGAYALAATPRGLWVTIEDDADPGLAQLDLRTGALRRRTHTDENVYLAGAGGYAASTLWATLQDGGVVRLDPRTGRILQTIDGEAFSVWTGAGQVWTSWPPDGNVQQLDPRTGKPAGPPLHVGGEMETVLTAFGATWAVDAATARLARIG